MNIRVEFVQLGYSSTALESSRAQGQLVAPPGRRYRPELQF